METLICSDSELNIMSFFILTFLQDCTHYIHCTSDSLKFIFGFVLKHTQKKFTE